MADDLRIVAAFATPIEADIARNRLRSADIQAFLGDEYSIGWLWHLGNALNGVKVLVAESDARQALDILAENRKSATEDVKVLDHDDVQDDEDEEDQPLHAWCCPKCDTAVDGEMDVCWACGTTREGDEDSAFLDEANLGTSWLGSAEPPAAEEEAKPPATREYVNQIVPPQEPAPEIWICLKCHTEVDGEMEVCWSCGTMADGTEDTEFQHAVAQTRLGWPATIDGTESPDSSAALVMPLFGPILLILGAAVASIAVEHARGSPAAQSLLMALAVTVCWAIVIVKKLFDRPSTSPQDGAVVEIDTRNGCTTMPLDAAGSSDDEWNLDTVQRVALARRACAAAIFGIWVCVPLLNFYSIWLIAKHELYRSEVRHEFPAFLYGAIVINAFVCMLISWMLLSFDGGFP